MSVLRHRAAHRHVGPRRWRWYRRGFQPGHAADREPATVAYADAFPPPARAALPAAPLRALPAPSLDLRPVATRPRGPHPYDYAPATAPQPALEAIA